MTNVYSWQNSISLCPASFCTPRPNLPIIPGVSWLLLLHSCPIWWKGHLFWVLVLKGLLGLHRIFQLQLLYHYCWGIDLDYCDIEWFALEMNGDHSVIFEIVSKYCILGSFVDYEGYSISSKGFLPTVVDGYLNKIHPLLFILVHWFLKCQCSLLPTPVWLLPICLDSWT